MEEEVSIDTFKQANISLILESYNDIFSSFDARSYSEKALSVDFLSECKRAARDKDNVGVELILSIPRAKRNLTDEVKIKHRLREHFHKHFLEKEKEIKKVKRNGLRWVFTGSFLLICNAILHTYLNQLLMGNFLLNLVSLLAEPASWFSFWEGLGKIFIKSGDVEPEIAFYKKMASAQINFRGY